MDADATTFSQAPRLSAATCGFWLVCSLLAVALAFPTLFVVLDHHGVERLPGHLHVGAASDIAAEHTHAFTQVHPHGPDTVPAVDTAAIVVRVAADTPALVLYALLGLVLLASGMVMPGARPGRWPGVPEQPRLAEALASPPTRPPTRSSR